MAEGNGNGSSSRWQLWLGVASGIFLINGAIITYVVQLADVRTTGEQNKDAIVELTRRADKTEDAENADRLEITRAQLTQIEIDTQLRASIDDANKSLAWQLRIDAMLWEQGFKGKSHLPIDNAFYPNIANGNSR